MGKETSALVLGLGDPSLAWGGAKDLPRKIFRPCEDAKKSRGIAPPRYCLLASALHAGVSTCFRVAELAVALLDKVGLPNFDGLLILRVL